MQTAETNYKRIYGLIDAGAIANDRHGIELFRNILQALSRGINDGDIVVLFCQALRQGISDLATADDDDFHEVLQSCNYRYPYKEMSFLHTGIQVCRKGHL